MFWLALQFATLRGLHPKLAHKYQTTEFICDGNKKMSSTAVNDNYCDCLDGTDEIGTSACNNGIFYCYNDGMPMNISTTWVDDGIQDCCDGSDEQEGINTCAVLKQELDSKRMEFKEKFTSGIDEKKKLIEFGLNWRDSSKNRIIEIDSTILTIEKELEQLDVLVSEFDKNEQFETDLFQCESFCLDHYSDRYNSIFEELKTHTDHPPYLVEALRKYEEIKSKPSPELLNFQPSGMLANLINWIPNYLRSSIG